MQGRITLDSLTFTQLCEEVRQGNEIVFIGMDEESDATSLCIPKGVVGNLILEPDEVD